MYFDSTDIMRISTSLVKVKWFFGVLFASGHFVVCLSMKNNFIFETKERTSGLSVEVRYFS